VNAGANILNFNSLRRQPLGVYLFLLADSGDGKSSTIRDFVDLILPKALKVHLVDGVSYFSVGRAYNISLLRIFLFIYLFIYLLSSVYF
jgi:hypothetical protein